MKNLLYLSHCVPNPPNKGEKIRSHQEINYLASRYRVHLVCFARGGEEVRAAHQLADRCASVFVENLSPVPALLRAAFRFALGECLNTAYYWSPRVKAHVDALAGGIRFDATLAYSTVMAPYSPPGVPILFDMQDVDSEKWLQYAQWRQPGFLFALEARRLRRVEAQWTRAAQCTLLTTDNEARVLSSFVPGAVIDYMENGIDGAFYDGVPRPLPPGLQGRKFVAFIGTMDYHPNVQGAHWFATQVFPELRRRHPDLEFLIIGRNPSKRAASLGQLAGVTVTGGVPDIRPFLAHARAVVAPLLLARGIQNKVLESLAMGRPVFASSAVCRTFGPSVPSGVVCCASEAEFVEKVSAVCEREPASDGSIRAEACSRFSWPNSLGVILNRLEALTTPHTGDSMLLEESLNGI